jgi:hypothetical protein
VEETNKLAVADMYDAATAGVLPKTWDAVSDAGYASITPLSQVTLLMSNLVRQSGIVSGVHASL